MKQIFKMSNPNSFSLAGFFFFVFFVFFFFFHFFFKSFSLSKVLLDKNLIFGSKHSNDGNHIFVSF